MPDIVIAAVSEPVNIPGTWAAGMALPVENSSPKLPVEDAAAVTDLPGCLVVWVQDTATSISKIRLKYFMATAGSIVAGFQHP